MLRTLFPNYGLFMLISATKSWEMKQVLYSLCTRCCLISLGTERMLVDLDDRTTALLRHGVQTGETGDCIICKNSAYYLHVVAQTF